jgi:hypothetical protein
MVQLGAREVTTVDGGVTRLANELGLKLPPTQRRATAACQRHESQKAHPSTHHSRPSVARTKREVMQALSGDEHDLTLDAARLETLVGTAGERLGTK